ncbi:hypothetical protein CDAR_4841 [Caerostris darwini]|uniref:Uncharacterized protein n=1 Tax=Caerostris darwini TaxID=1538125 RepID=A0AAV4P7P7_9ARAC|nr:hypothetical protein CDAR_4841 [Caerostris darwini]
MRHVCPPHMRCVRFIPGDGSVRALGSQSLVKQMEISLSPVSTPLARKGKGVVHKLTLISPPLCHRSLKISRGHLLAKRAKPSRQTGATKRAMPPTNRSNRRCEATCIRAGWIRRSARTSRSILVLLMCCPERDPGSIDP